MKRIETRSAFEAGQDYAKNGANEINCDFWHFATRELTKAWEQGRDSIQKPAKQQGLAALLPVKRMGQ